MGMGIVFGHAAMGRPTGVGNAASGLRLLGLRLSLELTHPTDSAQTL